MDYAMNVPNVSVFPEREKAREVRSLGNELENADRCYWYDPSAPSKPHDSALPTVWHYIFC